MASGSRFFTTPMYEGKAVRLCQISLLQRPCREQAAPPSRMLTKVRRSPRPSCPPDFQTKTPRSVFPNAGLLLFELPASEIFRAGRCHAPTIPSVAGCSRFRASFVAPTLRGPGAGVGPTEAALFGGKVSVVLFQIAMPIRQLGIFFAPDGSQVTEVRSGPGWRPRSKRLSPAGRCPAVGPAVACPLPGSAPSRYSTASSRPLPVA